MCALNLRSIPSFLLFAACVAGLAISSARADATGIFGIIASRAKLRR